jgi:uncharacterized protein (DUF2147 family)
MKRLIAGAMLGVSMLAAGCAVVGWADVEPIGGKDASQQYVNKEDRVTGSRLPRSESGENYQGTRSTTGQDYRDYKASTGLLGGP